jgi:hypothetical protein
MLSSGRYRLSADVAGGQRPGALTPRRANSPGDQENGTGGSWQGACENKNPARAHGGVLSAWWAPGGNREPPSTYPDAWFSVPEWGRMRSWGAVLSASQSQTTNGGHSPTFSKSGGGGLPAFSSSRRRLILPSLAPARGARVAREATEALRLAVN